MSSTWKLAKLESEGEWKRLGIFVARCRGLRGLFSEDLASSLLGYRLMETDLILSL